MIVTEKESWLGMIFAVHGTTMELIWPRVGVVFCWSILITTIAYLFPDHAYTLTMAPFTVVGLALAIFLGFRNNAAYDRYWEGRKLWGRMVNVCRSFTMQINTLVDDSTGESSAGASEDIQIQRLQMVRLIICHIHALRHRLRDSDPAADLEEQLPGDTQLKHDLAQDNVPAAIADRISRQINSAWRGGQLDKYHVPLLHNCLTEMMGIQGGCERIKSTPIPFTYSVLTHRTVFIYCMALPCGLHDTVGLMTPVVVALVAYFFLGLDAVGDEIEQPFMTDDNDLPLLQLTTMIERNVLQLSGRPDEELPEQIKPVDHLLIQGSGHLSFTRMLPVSHHGRCHGFYLIADDAGGELGGFYTDLGWTSWPKDNCQLSYDRCLLFYSFLWTADDSIEKSLHSKVPAAEVFELKNGQFLQFNED